jgi:hypothetical protein|tara:strand:+ start:2762 stop:3082 length:321 start_codon:yes stop_codon:yes gene_type:complete
MGTEDNRRGLERHLQSGLLTIVGAFTIWTLVTVQAGEVRNAVTSGKIALVQQQVTTLTEAVTSLKAEVKEGASSRLARISNMELRLRQVEAKLINVTWGEKSGRQR